MSLDAVSFLGGRVALDERVPLGGGKFLERDSAMSFQMATSPEAGRMYALAPMVEIWGAHHSVHDEGVRHSNTKCGTTRQCCNEGTDGVE